MATPLLIDTDVLIDYLRDYPAAVSYVEAQQERFLISVVMVAELYAGVRCSIASVARHRGVERSAAANSAAGRAKRRANQPMWAWMSAWSRWRAVCRRRRAAVSLCPSWRQRVRRALGACA
jgi:predicted nucleic acid-binding protein